MTECPLCQGDGGWWIEVAYMTEDWEACEDCRGTGEVPR